MVESFVATSTRRLGRLLGRQVLASWEGVQSRRGDRLCLFAHWDPHGVIDPYVLHYLERLADQGFDLILSSTAPTLQPESIREARRLCRRIVLRRNVGLDFASWKDAAPRLAAFDGYDAVLLANDSVFGPFRDLGPVLDRMAREPATLWGLTDSGAYSEHVQSYFVYIPRSTIDSRPFRSFWRQVRPLRDKDKIIHRYEIGLSRRLAGAGGSVWAVFPYREVLDHAARLGDGFPYRRLLGRPGLVNITILAWDILIEAFDFPFLKREVLTVDMRFSRRLDGWRGLIPAESRSLIELIDRYLLRTSPNCPGLRSNPEVHARLMRAHGLSPCGRPVGIEPSPVAP